jgi:hypothetical protein
MPNEDSGAVVVITNKDIYTELLKVKEAVSAMSPQALTIADHENRIRSVEKWKYSMPASLTASAIAIATAWIEGRH